MNKPNRITRAAPAAAALALLVALSGCEQEGPVERAGERIENALDDAGDRMEDLADEAEDAARDAGDELEDAADRNS